MNVLRKLNNLYQLVTDNLSVSFKMGPMSVLTERCGPLQFGIVIRNRENIEVVHLLLQ